MAKREFKGIAKNFIANMKLSFTNQGGKAEDIFVQDLYNYESPNVPHSFGNSIKNNLGELAKLSTDERRLLQSMLTIYNENIETKKQLLTQARELFETDIVQTIIDVMIDDGFNSFNNEAEEFRIEYDLDEEERKILGDAFQEQVQAELDDVTEKFGLKKRIEELIPELLRDGEYALGIVFEEGKGITDVVDDLDVINLLPFYEGNELAFVMEQTSRRESDKIGNHWDVLNNNPIANNIPNFYKPDNIVFFRLKGPTKKRINMSLFYDHKFRQDFLNRTGIRLPKYVRIPLPIFYSAMRNLKRLKLMEDVSTVLDLSDVLRPEILTVAVPTNTSAVEAQQITRNYERQLNESMGLEEGSDLSIQSLTAQANRRKVLPQWADNKGTLNSTGIGTGTSEKGQGAWNTIDKLRNLIALSVGIPPFYINISETPQDKAQVIKLYSRYTRKLTSLQHTLVEGLKDIYMIHCAKKGINISRDNINIKFKSITSGDSLDDTDMMVATVTGINDLYKGLEDIVNSENNNLTLDSAQFKELFDNLTSRYLNIADLLIVNDSKFNDVEGEDGMDSGFELEGPSNSSRDRLGGPDRGETEPLGNEPSNNEPLETEEDSYNEFVASSETPSITSPEEVETEI